MAEKYRGFIVLLISDGFLSAILNSIYSVCSETIANMCIVEDFNHYTVAYYTWLSNRCNIIVFRANTETISEPDCIKLSVHESVIQNTHPYSMKYKP